MGVIGTNLANELGHHLVPKSSQLNPQVNDAD